MSPDMLAGIAEVPFSAAVGQTVCGVADDIAVTALVLVPAFEND